MKNIINFKDYINNKNKKLAKVLEKREKLIYTDILSKKSINSLEKLVEAILQGNEKEISKICTKMGWSFEIIWNPVEYSNTAKFAVVLDLDPNEYTIESNEIDLFVVTANTINDCLLDLADGIIEHIGE